MKVSELIALLQAKDPDARVGVSLSDIHGWVSDVEGLMIAPDGTVCLDQRSRSLFEDEVDLVKG